MKKMSTLVLALVFALGTIAGFSGCDLVKKEETRKPFKTPPPRPYISESEIDKVKKDMDAKAAELSQKVEDSIAKTKKKMDAKAAEAKKALDAVHQGSKKILGE